MAKTQSSPTSPLARPRQEAFAQALGRGMAPVEAARAAGYKTAQRRGQERSRQPEIAARVAVLKANDTPALIDELIAIGRRASKFDDPRGLGVARACLVDAALLKLARRPRGLTSAAPPSAVQLDPILAELDRDLSDEEWTRRFGPDAPGGRVGDGGGA